MKGAILAVGLLVLVGCTTNAEDFSAARAYKLDLQYIDYAIGFANQGMMAEAMGACEQTQILMSECAISIVGKLQQKGLAIPSSFCETITPRKGIAMSANAIDLVYHDIDETLLAELREQVNPSSSRIATLTTIKERCLA